MPELLPSHYHDAESANAVTGLTGSLPLLLSLAALASDSRNVRQVLTSSVRGNKWVHHPGNRYNGRSMKSSRTAEMY